MWETVSTSEGIAKWFMPNDFQQKIGHEFHLQSPFGPSPCKVTEKNPPNRLSFAWDTDGWIVSFNLKELETKRSLLLFMVDGKNTDIILQKQGGKCRNS